MQSVDIITPKTLDFYIYHELCNILGKFYDLLDHNNSLFSWKYLAAR